MTLTCLKKRALRMAVAAFSEQRWYPDAPQKSKIREGRISDLRRGPGGHHRLCGIIPSYG
jgi:hypothetical protein